MFLHSIYCDEQAVKLITEKMLGWDIGYDTVGYDTDESFSKRVSF